MNRLNLFAAALALRVACIAAAATAPEQDYLSPIALAASSDGQRVYVACATAAKLLAVDLPSGQAGKPLALPASPSGIALSPDGSRLYITCASAKSYICVVDVRRWKVVRAISTWHTAMSPVCDPEGKALYVCNRFNDSISIFTLPELKERARVAVPREPVAAAISPDGTRLFVANHIHTGRSDTEIVAASVSVLDTTVPRVMKEILLPNGSTLLRGIAVSPDGKLAAVTHLLAHFYLPPTQIERGWINNNALTLIDVANLEPVSSVLLDNLDSGAANPWAVAWTPDGKCLAVTHAGTHELSLIDAGRLLEKLRTLPAKAATPGHDNSVSRTAADVPNDLAFLLGCRERIKLTGKGPRALAWLNNYAVVANYFSDSLSLIDLSVEPRAEVSIPLGGSSCLSARRQGELSFNDASICFQGWQSCASCHSSDARVDGMNWDNLNDGLGNPKNVKSLLLAHRTPPSMWLGVRSNAEAAVRAGITNSLFAVAPNGIANAIDEYLQSLQPTPSPWLVNGRLSKAAQRGKKLFFDEGIGCADCHKGPLLTDCKLHNVETAGAFDPPATRFDTPSLIEAWRTAPYLHDGSAPTIRDVMTTRNRGNAHGATSRLTPAQIDDLAAFVLSQ